MEIFNFVNENSNDLLSKMNEIDKKELLELLKSYKLSLKDTLNLDKNITFGLELEFEKEDQGTLENQTNALNYVWLKNRTLSNDYWLFKKETSSIIGYEISSPILTDKKESYDQLKQMCEMLKKNNVILSEKDAGHIHIGTQVIGNNYDNWFNFFKMYILYENIIYRFGYGEYENKREYITSYASPLAKRYNSLLNRINDYDPINIRKLFKMLKPLYKKDALSFYKVYEGGTSFENNRTIEFRMPNASIEPIIWQNNINFFVHLLKSSNKVDLDLINDKIKNKENTLNNLEYYNEINVNEALELADLIFDNNRDKIDFLRQYMKEFTTNNEFRKTKEFIKR